MQRGKGASDIEALRAEIVDLTADRDRWQQLYYRAANEALRHSPPTRFKRPGPLPETVTLTGDGPSTSDVVSHGRDITAESVADFKAGMTFSWEDLWANIDACGQHWDEVMTFEEMDAAKGTRGADQETLALLALLGLSSEDMASGRVASFGEALSAIKNAAKALQRTPFPADAAEAEAVQAYNARVKAHGTFAAPITPSDKRLATLAMVLESPLDRLERFLDMLGKQPLTEDRIAGAQHALGLPTPVCSHLEFPLMNLPSNREACELLEEFGLRKQAIEGRKLASEMDEIQAEVREVRRARARAKRKGTPRD